MSNYVATSDLYESALYHASGFTIEGIEIIKENRKEIAVFTFSGDNIKKIQLEYFNGTIKINLLDFRSSYLHLASLIGTARKEAKLRQAQLSSKGGVQ